MRKERKILRFVPQKLRKSFANGNPSSVHYLISLVSFIILYSWFRSLSYMHGSVHHLLSLVLFIILYAWLRSLSYILGSVHYLKSVVSFIILYPLFRLSYYILGSSSYILGSVYHLISLVPFIIYISLVPFIIIYSAVWNIFRSKIPGLVYYQISVRILKKTLTTKFLDFLHISESICCTKF